MFKNLHELITSMPDEKTCREYLIKERWNGVITCPYCKHEKCYVIEGGKRFKCASKACYKKFSATVGTVMEASNIPLTKWFMGIYLVTAHKRGISSYQLARDLGIAQKNSWFMIHRIREALRSKQGVQLGESKPVEADETFVGGKYANMHLKKRKKIIEENDGNPYANKTTVLGMIEREGKLVAKVIPKKQPHEIGKTIAETVIKGSTLITDTANLYAKITHHYNYLSVNHSIQVYVKNNAHTNSIEGAFSHFKRSIYGTFFQISAKHTQRYCDEFAYKFNSRKIKDSDRFNHALGCIEGRLTYKKLIAVVPQKDIVLTEKPKNRGYGIIQLRDGEIIGQYSSIFEAQQKTGIDRNNIRKACKGERDSAGGYEWIYS